MKARCQTTIKSHPSNRRAPQQHLLYSSRQSLLYTQIMSRYCQVCRSLPSSWRRGQMVCLVTPPSLGQTSSSSIRTSSLHRRIAVMDFIPVARTSSIIRTQSTTSQQQTSKLNIKGNIVQPVSDEQRRAAQLELDRMNTSTSRLLQMTSALPISEAIVNETRVALNYWSRRWYIHFHPGFGRAAKGSQLSLQALRQWDMHAHENSQLRTFVSMFFKRDQTSSWAQASSLDP